MFGGLRYHFLLMSCYATGCAGAVELRNTVTSLFGVELTATASFDHPTIDALARYIASRTAPPAASAQPSQQAAPAMPSAAVIARRLAVRTPRRHMMVT